MLRLAGQQLSCITQPSSGGAKFEADCGPQWDRDQGCNREARRSNQSILKEISPGISLEEMMLKLKLQCFGLIGKDSDAGRDCGQEEKGTTEDERAGWHH